MSNQQTSDLQTQIEAATFRKLLAHLDNNKDVQNIDLMILADFCRNCLSDYEQAREIVYGMPYSQWKEHHQPKATPEQLTAFEAKKTTKK